MDNSLIKMRLSVLAGVSSLVFAALLTGCSSSSSRVAARSQESLPKLAGSDTVFRFQTFLFKTPQDFSFLEDSNEAHLAGIYSQEEGEKLVASLQKRRGFELLTSPTVTTRNGKTGSFSDVRELIYPTEYNPPEIPKKGSSEGEVFPVTPSSPSSFEMRQLGLTGSFQSRVKGADEIEVELKLQRDALLGFVNYGSPILTESKGLFGKSTPVVITENRIEMPVFSSRKLATTVSLRPGQYIAIGGLSSDDFTQLDKAIRENADIEVEDGVIALIRVDAERAK